jgi:hypothetical protein
MKRFALLIVTSVSFSTNLVPPPEWVKGFWAGYEAGKREIIKDKNLLEEILFVKEQILKSKIPPIVIEGNKCKVLSKDFLKLVKPQSRLEPGYYTVIDTSELSTAQKYYLISLIKEQGWNAIDKGSIYVGAFPTQKDAEKFKELVEKRYGITAFISVVK